jgi:ketol-acid reductoisomerase
MIGLAVRDTYVAGHGFGSFIALYQDASVGAAGMRP